MLHEELSIIQVGQPDLKPGDLLVPNQHINRLRCVKIRRLFEYIAEIRTLQGLLRTIAADRFKC